MFDGQRLCTYIHTLKVDKSYDTVKVGTKSGVIALPESSPADNSNIGYYESFHILSGFPDVVFDG